MTSFELADLESVPLAIAGESACMDLPVGWLVAAGPAVVATPPSWDGDPPGVVVSIERDAVRGDALAAAVADAALTRLGDPVIVSLTRHGTSDDHGGSDSDHRCDVDRNGTSASIPADPDPDPTVPDDDLNDVEIIVAHQHRGVDVTTVERHHCRPGPLRWVVGFTLAHRDVPRWLAIARRVAASLRTTSS